MARGESCRSELDLAALLDQEMDHQIALATRRHLTRCLECSERYEALRSEHRLLEAAISVEEEETRAVRLEFGWVVAAGLLLSTGLLVFRRLLSEAGGADASPVPEELLTRLVYGLLRLVDFAAILTEISIGGLLAMTLLALTLLTAAGRRLRPRAAPVLLVGALAATLAGVPAPAEAYEVRAGREADCRVAEGEVIEDDLVLMCSNAVIAGVVRGDVYYLGESVTVSGRVDGDLMGLSERIDIEGEVGLSWRGAAQTARILGRVERGVTAAGQLVEIRPRASVGGGVVLAGEHLIVSGPVARSLFAAGGRVELDSSVGGDLRVAAAGLEMGRSASVGGSAEYHGDREPVRAPGAPQIEWIRDEPEETSAWEAVSGVLRGFGRAFVLGAFLVLLASGSMAGIAAVGGRPLAPMGVGVLLFVGLPFTALLAAITLVGLPLALTLLALYLFLLYAAQVVAGLVIGQAILGHADSRWRRLLRLALGLAVVAVAVEIPVAGFAVSLLVMFLGLGAVGLWAWRSKSTALA